MSDRREGAIGDGPYLWIAVMAPRTEEVPVNATRLLREWEHLVTPLEAMAETLERTKDFPWEVGEAFIEPSFTSTALMREAIDRGFRDQLVESGIHAKLRSRSSFDDDKLRDWATGESFRQHSSHLVPVMYGLAVMSIVRDLPGYYSAQINEIEQRRKHEKAEALRENADADVEEFRTTLDEAEPDDFRAGG